ncbi:HK97 gp10 family phage protein [Enterococcus faecalis]|uniref:HK97 gp10 family phage protein n=2 Tax=Enterococcus faecalis TaxID=1351 RepID=UPI00228CDC0D|nr:HK97 gp10 family phage protein [Enterococcus faecalis]HAP4123774.1 HK97 gp10 family phage protein [Enterococcus faecalis]HAP4255709.1 HK97 gp10 family phage protein [Enterococcus faecalis]HAP4258885.1 HK97 gp10 family phage protein [Enterococcus faecalis]HCT6708339.1 HK97 gp10 family phage protein [Enterococcus faecalis]
MSKSDLRMKSNADKVIKNLKKMTPIAEKEGAAMVNDSLAKIYQLIVPLTPVKSGDLRRGYRIIKARKLSSGRIVGALINDEKYFRYVNDGHRTKNGGFVKGRFMLQKSNKLANATYIPKRFKQMAIIIVKKG